MARVAHSPAVVQCVGVHPGSAALHPATYVVHDDARGRAAHLTDPTPGACASGVLEQDDTALRGGEAVTVPGHTTRVAHHAGPPSGEPAPVICSVTRFRQPLFDVDHRYSLFGYLIPSGT